MKILKFGGSSVGSADRIKQVTKIIQDKISKKDPLFVIFSAYGGMTDQLIRMGKKAALGDLDYKNIFIEFEKSHLEVAKDLLSLQNRTDAFTQIKISLNELDEILHGVYLVKELTAKTLDYIMSFGERLSAFTINEILRDNEMNSTFIDSRQVVLTDYNFGKAKIQLKETNKNIVELTKSNHDIYAITGFIGATPEGETSTLGRGGSDFTASVFGAALDVEEIEIWTDVNGVMTADPTKVPEAFSLRQLTYEEAMELSHFGARVIYPPTMQPALDKKIPIRVLNTLNPEFAGTVISDQLESNKTLIKGISSIDDVCLLLIQGSGMIGVAGIAQRIFSALAKEQINIILISQASSEHSICLAVMPEFALAAKKAVENELRYELLDKQVNEISIEKNMTILAVVGEKMRHTRGIAARVFESLGKNGINISAIAQGSSELNISLVIAKHDETKALNTLHDAFFLSETKSLHLYLVGTGLIGKSLLDLIQKQASRLAQKSKITIKIAGLANSRKMLLMREGIAYESWQKSLETAGTKSNMDEFIARMKEFNLRNSIFVDCTANDEISLKYPQIFLSKVSIATPNKIANSVSYEYYRELRELAGQNNVHFHYETNVGAALPVINTIQDLVASGDRVIKLNGMLSGTLSYIFSRFDGTVPFSQIIREAKDLGYTEPDPREDLSGMDVSRKLLILLREAGIPAEPADIKTEKLISPAVENADTIEQAINQLAEEDSEYERKRKAAEKDGNLLRYIATFNKDTAEVGLKSIGINHPFAKVTSTENIIAIHTEHYGEHPLIIRGPGAGKEITAAGVYADILRIANLIM